MKYLIGIDGGSQSTKMAVYDFEGNIICGSDVKLRPMHLASGGIVEHPDDDLWDSLCKAAKNLLSKFDGNISDIMGVGLCTIRFCRCLLKRDGTLSQPAMSWMDQRVSLPHVQNNSDTAYVTTSSGYITRRLTGENRDTAANYLGAWPFDRSTWGWDEAGFEAFGVKRGMLFDLVMPGDILGYISAEASEATGLPNGLPVFATANDKAVEALGVGCTKPGMSLLSLGTYIAAMTCTDNNRGDSDNGWTNLASVPNRYFFETMGIRRGMWMLSWWADVIGEDFAARAGSLGIPPEELLNREAGKIPAGSDGLIVIPHWLAPVHQPYKKGMMLGFDGRHGRAHIYRAILEGIALTMKNNIDVAGGASGQFFIAGGGSKSDVFMQIFADVLGKPVTRPGSNSSAGLGSAICAAVGLGIWSDFDIAAEKMVRGGVPFEPIVDNTVIYEKLNDVYKNLDRFGDDLFQKTYSIFG